MYILSLTWRVEGGRRCTGLWIRRTTLNRYYYIILVQLTVSGVLLNSRMREIELTLFNDAANTIQQQDDGRTVFLAQHYYLEALTPKS